MPCILQGRTSTTMQHPLVCNSLTSLGVGPRFLRQRVYDLQVNPHVSRILQTQKQLGERPRFIPRQNGPCAQRDAGFAAAGVSAFAFQGTNAHAVLCRTAHLPAASNAQQPLWQRRRLWCAHYSFNIMSTAPADPSKMLKAFVLASRAPHCRHLSGHLLVQALTGESFELQ